MVENKTKVELEDNTRLTTRNYLVQNCAVCKKEMELVTGSIIFGNKWYHKDCYDSTQPSLKRD